MASEHLLYEGQYVKNLAFTQSCEEFVNVGNVLLFHLAHSFHSRGTIILYILRYRDIYTETGCSAYILRYRDIF